MCFHLFVCMCACTGTFPHIHMHNTRFCTIKMALASCLQGENLPDSSTSALSGGRGSLPYDIISHSLRRISITPPRAVILPSNSRRILLEALAGQREIFQQIDSIYGQLKACQNLSATQRNMCRTLHSAAQTASELIYFIQQIN